MMNSSHDLDLTERINAHNSEVAGALERIKEMSKSGQAYRSLNDILDELILKSVTHFEYEDAQLEIIKGDNYRMHISEHSQLLRKLENFKAMLERQRITRPFLKFLEYWLSHHAAIKDGMIGVTTETDSKDEDVEDRME